MPRLTIHNLTSEAHTALKELCQETGATLGEALSSCILAGIGEARKELESKYDGEWYPELADDLAEVRRYMQVFQETLTLITDHLVIMQQGS